MCSDGTDSNVKSKASSSGALWPIISGSAGGEKTFMDYTYVDIIGFGTVMLVNPAKQVVESKLKADSDISAALKKYPIGGTSVSEKNSLASPGAPVSVHFISTNAISIDVQTAGQYRVQLYHLNGRLIASFSWNLHEGSNVMSLTDPVVSEKVVITRISSTGQSVFLKSVLK